MKKGLFVLLVLFFPYLLYAFHTTKEVVEAYLPEEVEEGVFDLVTDASTLAEGDFIVIANAEFQVALGPQSGNFRSGVPVEVMDNAITGAGMTLFELEKSGNNWLLKTQDTGYYLYAKGSSYAILETSSVSTTGTKATITISDGFATIKFNTSNYQYLRLSSGAPADFRGYNYATSVDDIQIYRQRNASGQTGVKYPNVEPSADAKVYHINGHMVGTKTENLNPGVYIKHGKKFFVK